MARSPVQSTKDRKATYLESTLDYRILYTSECPPQPLSHEQLIKQPVRVQPLNDEKLPPECRANFSKVYAVEQDHRVLDVELVTSQQIYLLQLYCNASYKRI
jgi:hypothetical protein